MESDPEQVGAGQAGRLIGRDRDPVRPPRSFTDGHQVGAAFNTEGCGPRSFWGTHQARPTQQEQPLRRWGHSPPLVPTAQAPPTPRASPRPPKETEGGGRSGRTCSHTHASPPGQGLLVTSRVGRGPAPRKWQAAQWTGVQRGGSGSQDRELNASPRPSCSSTMGLDASSQENAPPLRTHLKPCWETLLPSVAQAER